MEEYSDESNQIRETDIVFDCPYCSKSLAIDYRGAGLNVQCTDCGRNVQVPIPEGMDISDLDSSVEEQEVRILNLRRTLAMAEERISSLEAELERLRAMDAGAASASVSDNGSLDEIVEQVREIQQAQAEILTRLDFARETSKKPT